MGLDNVRSFVGYYRRICNSLLVLYILPIYVQGKLKGIIIIIYFWGLHYTFLHSGTSHESVTSVRGELKARTYVFSYV